MHTKTASVRLMGFISNVAVTVATTRTRKAAPYDSFRGLDDAVLKDIGILRADLYTDEPRDRG
jgi:uncharacterized protein YjiS (DUF1127 family)